MTAEQLGDFGFADKAAERRRGELLLGYLPVVVFEVVPQCAHLEAGIDVYLEPLVEVLDGIAIVLARGADVERRAVGYQIVALAKDVIFYRKAVFCIGFNVRRCNVLQLLYNNFVIVCYC